jgi:tetratricopeptide (TPR) repeat protein
MLLALTRVVPCLAVDEKPWKEVRSAHFRVITNGTELSAKQVARELEQMRGVFEQEFPGFALDKPPELIVVAARDPETAARLIPGISTTGRAQTAGLYFRGWDREYAMVRLDLLAGSWDPNEVYGVVYHEYIHKLLHSNFHWLPRWLDEGLAGFYQYTRIEGKHIYVGAPPKTTRVTDTLDHRTLIPIEAFIAQNSMVVRGADDSLMNYAQAWALTHYLTFGPGMDQGQRLIKFFKALQNGKPQKTAFTETFGSFADVDKAFGLYVAQYAYPTKDIPNRLEIEDKNFATRVMSQAETEAELSELKATMYRWDEAKEYAEAAVRHDDKLGLAQEALANVELHNGKADEAAKDFASAYTADQALYLSLFAQTMLQGDISNPAGRDALHEQLLKVVAVKPDYAPPYVQLAKLEAAKRNFGQALKNSMKAEELAPFRAGYHLLSGDILLGMGDPGDASVYASFVAERWGFPELEQAIELWQRAPEKYRRGPAPTPVKLEEGMKTVEGTVESSTCEGKMHMIKLTGADGKTYTFKGERIWLGYADTLWLADHFTMCYYTKGMRAVANYKSSADKSFDGELRRVAFRDDISTEPKKETTAVH